MRDKGNKQQQEDKIHGVKGSPKRNAPSDSFIHRQHENRDKAIFSGFTFSFPLTDSQISPKQIQLLTQSIIIEGGQVIQFKNRSIKREIDYLLINPSKKPETVMQKIDGKLNFKQMLDYHFITDCLKEGRLKNFEKYSLYVNIPQIWSAEKQHIGRKKVKKDSEEETVKLSDQDEEEPRAIMKVEKSEKKRVDKEKMYDEKEQMEDILLTHKNIGDNSFSMNKFIAEQLTKLMKIYATERDIGRKIAYMKAAAVIRNLDKEIQSDRDVENIKGIGKKISDKIKELLGTGKISKLTKLQGSEKNQVLGEFVKIWGIGPSKAQELYGEGIKTIEDLKYRTQLLTKNQKLGLKYFEEFQAKIPRQKVTKMFEFVQKIFSKMVPSLDMYNLQVCGSYRRGKATCGDMDIIITRKDGHYEKNLLVQLVKELEKTGFLTDHLTTPKASDTRSSVSYMGVCQFQGPTHHRIDIKYYPHDQFAYAILYFTGSGTFNRMMRLHCMKEGLNLSDHGAIPKKEKDVIWTKPIPTCLTERDIFNFIGLEYKTPQERDL